MVGGKPKPQLTERQLARERAKLAHAAQGHLSVAAEHRAAGRLEQAKVHEALASDLPGAYRAMAKELADRAAKSADRHESRSLAAQAAKLRERADEVAAILPK